MIILGIYDRHDACAALYDDYRLLAAVAQERVTRVKSDGGRFPAEAVEECLAAAALRATDVDVCVLPRTYYPRQFYSPGARLMGVGRIGEQGNLLEAMLRSVTRDPHGLLDVAGFLRQFGLSPKHAYFYNHHAAHALGALFHTDWREALVYTSDGGGDRVYYSAWRLDEERFEPLFGGERDSLALWPIQRRQDSLGMLYAIVTLALGMRPNRDEGKVLGLAAFGEPIYAAELRQHYIVDRTGQIRGLQSIKKTGPRIQELVANGRREDVAASVQQVLEDVTLEALRRLVHSHPTRYFAASGGVFANVKLTQRIAAQLPFDEVFVYPAMSDQGEAAGGVLQYLAERDGMRTWLSHRARFPDLFLGRNYMATADRVFTENGAIRQPGNDIARVVGEMIAAGKIIGTYLGPMEYGPRALGARSIMAPAIDRSINDWLNKRLDRTDFMPFAPVVRAERARDVFELSDSVLYAAQFMTVTCDVKPEWRARLPAITHVDGTARPQVIHRRQNPVYYDALASYEALTGLPVVINTSFNVHDEPIINKPDEAWIALRDGRVDYVTTDTAVWARPGG